MKQDSRPIHERDGFELFAFYLLAAILLFAPLIKGGNRPLPLLLLELAAVLLLAYPLARPVFWQRLSTGLLLGLALLMLLPALQLLPMPFSMWQTLPGRDVYAGALTAFGTTTDTHALSLLPMATELAWLALLPPLAVFLVAVSLPEAALRKCVYLFIAMATAQAILALVQFGGGATTTFRTSLSDIGTGVGTYVNRNHLAGMLAMALPISLGLLASRIGQAGGNLRYRSRSLIRRMATRLNPARLNQTLIFSAISIVILLGAIFSRSRTGIMLAMLGIFLTAVLYGFRIGGRRSTNLVTVFSVIGLALAVEVGLAPVLERFSAEAALEDARWSIFGSSITALGQFFPFGSGLGTFPDIYRRFQPAEISLFVNHAHNDYIEYLFEGGLMAAVVVLLFLFAYVRAWPRLLRLQRWGTLSFMQAGAGIGLLLMALHGLTDYNWHIPANAIYFALLAAVFLHRGETPREPRAHAHRLTAEAPVPSLPVVRTNATNPFAD
ncbi:MAG: O-antigen ligase domain-containing protein [Thiobacillus sp.]|nr:O-antigen ligase domain-containing protein [Thiobacillus sp.]